MRFEEGIDPPDVGVEVRAIAGGNLFLRVFSGLPDAEYALFAIELDCGFTDYFGLVSSRGAPHHIHLPQAVLRGYVALSKEQVFEGCGFNRGNTMSIADDSYFLGNSGDSEVAVELGNGGMGGPIKPPDDRDECGDQQAQGVVQNAQRGMTLTDFGSNLGQRSGGSHY